MLETPFTRDRWPVAPCVLAARPGSIFGAALAWPWLPALGSAVLSLIATWLVHRDLSLFQNPFYGWPDLAGLLVAALLAHAALQRMAALPPFVTNTQVVPVMALAFCSVFFAANVAGFAPTPSAYVMTFASTVGWYFAVGIARGKLFKRRVAFVGGTVPASLLESEGIEWRVLTEPMLTEPVSAIVVGRAEELAPEWQHFIGQAVLEGLPVHDARHMAEVISGRVQLRHFMENSFGTLLPALLYVRVKRYADVFLALLAIVIVLPVLAVFTVLIRLESPGPAIFRQQRTGYRGRPFTCYKLRSMRHGAAGPKFTLERDSRITGVGRFVRKYRIDELPQIFNILKGEMSWIGPRPEAVELAEAYEAAIPFYLYRHAVRPGVSGWAAVHQGNVGDVDAASVKLQYDLFYIKYCSLWLDVWIFCKTLKTLFTGFGSR